jgi:uncharacterized protein with beta-barrel porin domain
LAITSVLISARNQSRSLHWRSAGFESLPGAAFTVRGAALPKNVALVTGEADFQVGPGLCTLVKFDSALALRANAIGGSATLRYAF